MAKATRAPRARPDTWMPMFWGDYHRDTGHLNATQHGFYLLLIGHYWSTGQPFPDDDAQLWRIARADSLSHWKRNRSIIAALFKIADGVWKHSRVERELADAKVRQAAAKDRASKAARTRWAIHDECSEHTTSNPGDCPPPPHPPSQSVTTIPSVANSAPVGASHTPRAQLITESWEPSELDLAALRKERPDLIGPLYDTRMRDFRDWCAAQATRSFNPAATWRGFMRKTKTVDSHETFDQRRIREGLEMLRQ